MMAPKGHDGAAPLEGSDASWAGEALIDAPEFQAVQVTTHFAEHIPLWVKTIFGTNSQHFEFKVDYARFDDGIWFPVNYGGEFNLKVVHLYKRTMVIDLKNSSFRKATATASLAFDSAGAGLQ